MEGINPKAKGLSKNIIPLMRLIGSDKQKSMDTPAVGLNCLHFSTKSFLHNFSFKIVKSCCTGIVEIIFSPLIMFSPTFTPKAELFSTII